MDSCKKIVNGVLDLPIKVDLYVYYNNSVPALSSYLYLIYYKNKESVLPLAGLYNKENINKDLNFIINTDSSYCLSAYYPDPKAIKIVGKFIETIYEL